MFFARITVRWHCWLGRRAGILSPEKNVCPLILQFFDAVGWMKGRDEGPPPVKTRFITPYYQTGYRIKWCVAICVYVTPTQSRVSFFLT